MRTRYDPLNDFLFYKIMGEKGDEIQLLGFLNAVLGKTGNDCFTSVKIIENKTFIAKAAGEKTSVLDVRAILQDTSRINIEVQLRNQHNMDKRGLFYWSKEYTENLAAGQDYIELPNVISINIVNFDFPNTNNFHSCFHLREDTEHEIILTYALEIHYLNMVKYRKLEKKLKDPLNRWLAWFDAGSPPELVTEVVKMDAAIQAANERMMNVTDDKEARRIYWRHQMALSDRTGEINYARSEGRAEGQKYILELLEQGLSIEEIKQRL